MEVTDAGDGMSKEVRFEPFFKTKEIGKGSGLDLIQVLGFAQAIRRRRAHPLGCRRGYDHRNLPTARRRQTGQD